MQTQKYNHLRGSKIYGTGIFILVAILLIVAGILFVTKRVEPFAAITIIVPCLLFVHLACRLYKPFFTEVYFFRDGIESQTGFESKKLKLKDLKGIWVYKGQDQTIEPYTPQCTCLKNNLIIMGDIRRFEEARYISGILRDTFSDGYATIYYRKEIDACLKHYYELINS